MPKEEIELGDLVREKITGLEGIAIAKTEWLNGCVRFSVQGRVLDKEGKVPDPQCFDIQQIALVQKQAFYQKAKPRGGPMPDPQRSSDPAR